MTPLVLKPSDSSLVFRQDSFYKPSTLMLNSDVTILFFCYAKDELSPPCLPHSNDASPRVFCDTITRLLSKVLTKCK